MSWDDVKGVVYALAPTIGLLLVFYVVIRSIIRADASEREAAGQFGDRAERDTDDPASEPSAPRYADPNREPVEDGKDDADDT